MKPELDRLAVAFVHVLRRAGLQVPIGAMLTFARALSAVGLERRERVYWAGRATLLRGPHDVPAYDGCFAAFWTGASGSTLAPAPPVEPRAVEPRTASLAMDGEELGTQEQPDAGPTITLRWSPVEVLRDRDFAAYSPSELTEAQRLIDDLRVVGSSRRSRRHQPTSHRRGRPSLSRSLRRSLRSGGELIDLAYTRPGSRRRRVILLCDVSGSMEPYARAFLRFVHAAGRHRNVEAFAIGTRLTRVTRELATRDPDAALAAVTRRVRDSSGGTRLGPGLRTFNDEWGLRGLARGAVVVILSDGWDRADPEELEREMQRLHRVAHRVIWANPLKETPGFEPLARGMAAALPYVDDFVSGHSLDALGELAAVINQ